MKSENRKLTLAKIRWWSSQVLEFIAGESQALVGENTSRAQRASWMKGLALAAERPHPRPGEREARHVERFNSKGQRARLFTGIQAGTVEIAGR